MSLLKLLGLEVKKPQPRSRNRLVEAIRKRLEKLPAERAEFVAAFAGLLVRVAHADMEISPAERRTLRRLVAERVGLSPAESDAVAEIVTRQAQALAGIEYAALTRAFNELASEGEKKRLIDCLYAIATADSPVSIVEDEEIRAVSRALLLSHQQFIAIRQRYKDELEVMQALRRQRRGN